MYFSGFCLKDEKVLFEQYLNINDFTVSGFSFGAIKAFEYSLKEIRNKKRIDKLQLLSPAYFINKTDKYKRLQLMYFKKDKTIYRDNFINNIRHSSKINLSKFITDGSYSDLELLLNYNWNKDELNELLNANVMIEVYLGEDDKIIDSVKVKEFFKNFAEVYFIKDVGHIL